MRDRDRLPTAEAHRVCEQRREIEPHQNERQKEGEVRAKKHTHNSREMLLFFSFVVAVLPSFNQNRIRVCTAIICVCANREIDNIMKIGEWYECGNAHSTTVVVVGVVHKENRASARAACNE